jgi:hypothetical protein
MERRDIVIGLVILLVLAGIVYWVARPKQTPIEDIEPSPSIEEQLEEQFNTEVPEDADKVELEDTSGGDSRGIAFRKIVGGALVLSFLADLVVPEDEAFYQAWVVKEGEDGQEEMVSLGKLTPAKGGYVLEHSTQKDLEGYDTVIISKETVYDDQIEEKVLESSF